ncbi:hypothetical protein [Vibrio sagamiensis]|uniref:Lipoprotein n=1 Tax=Vibrio sagamiensis NBRC 104589 TaxID=1219064 RepID=A0A511QEU2_9VIBR|nr:hypothetical protein [Vibrio sagamiensis]PNQ53717.1 hypothetical protein C1141_19750 [Vibrio agarivorans]GEM75821.1 hypothetical protein VSA01S_19330 [Vibrio sagamiensis NBRC 104589]
MKMNKAFAFSITSALSFSALSAQCDFSPLVDELSVAPEQQRFSQYFAPVLLQNFKKAKTREYNMVVYLQETSEQINSEEKQPSTDIFINFITRNLAGITQSTNTNPSDIESVNAVAERFKTYIESIHSMDDAAFFDEFMTGPYREGSYYYDFFQQAVNQLDETVKSSDISSCSVDFELNLDLPEIIENQYRYSNDIQVSIDQSTNKISSPDLLKVMFDFSAAAYEPYQLTDDMDNGADFDFLPDEHLYKESNDWLPE